MKVHKPEVVPEFYMDPTPRVVYVVRLVTGELCNANDEKDAIKMLGSQCQQYVKFMQMLAKKNDDE
jgi:hypothetical protein